MTEPLDSFTQDFARGYVECALWASMDDEGKPLDAIYTEDDFDDETIATMISECAAFVNANRADLIEASETRDADYLGHDFWLTRNYHGSGFWDRGLGLLGDRLAKAAHAEGSRYLFVQDGRIYQQ